MNNRAILAAVLVVLGVVVLAYSGITFNTPGSPSTSLVFTWRPPDSHFVPPIVGLIALIAGIVLFASKPKQI